MSLAREKVHSDGYNYSKKGSRSKVLTTNEQGRREKRKYVQEEVRKERITEISENIASLKETIKFLQLQKVKYANSEKFLEAAEMNKRILEENTKKRKLEVELQKLSNVEAKSVTYKKRKMAKSSTVTKHDSDDAKSLSSEGGDTDIITSSEGESPPPVGVKNPLAQWLKRSNALPPTSKKGPISRNNEDKQEKECNITSTKEENNKSSIPSVQGDSQTSNCKNATGQNSEDPFLVVNL